jgi:hypothetical protein
MVDHCNLCTSLKQSLTLSFHLALNDSELEDPVGWLWLHSMIGLISVQLSLCRLGTFQCFVFIPRVVGRPDAQSSLLPFLPSLPSTLALTQIPD